MEVGIDHKPFYVDIDTGSSLTWVHCRLKPDLMSPKQGPNGFYEAENSDRIVLCNERICSIADDYHDPDDCDDADPDYCQYDLRYADNLGTKGVLVKDSVGLMLHSHQVDVELAFGCGYSQTGCEYEVGPGKLPVLRSDGILGLSKKPASIPSQLHAKRLIRYLIGHCFLPFHKRSGSHVGILLFGKSDMTTKGIRWARMIEREHMTIQSAYEGEVVQVKYGNRLVASFVQDHPERFVTFDSGTSMIWLTKGLFQALHDQISAEANRIGHEALPNTALGNLAIGGTRCWRVRSSLKEVPFRHFKDITFGFTPDLSKWCTSCVPSFFSKSWPIAKFVMPPSNYLTINVSHLGLSSQLILELLPQRHSKLLQVMPCYYYWHYYTPVYYSHTFLYYKHTIHPAHTVGLQHHIIET
ncbi:hypothetical protein KC19_7G122300 [Ceratodon purpureus]|nr:hypothetical protein KC19_7G122300 [Ceratodon purpureus]KAG0567266.1 hypothetical protein KC19_7G122300 [Ceratodon purpureus]